jgi:hypothetical protein
LLGNGSGWLSENALDFYFGGSIAVMPDILTDIFLLFYSRGARAVHSAQCAMMRAAVPCTRAGILCTSVLIDLFRQAPGLYPEKGATNSLHTVYNSSLMNHPKVPRCTFHTLTVRRIIHTESTEWIADISAQLTPGYGLENRY